jgi:phosphoglycolate phosphatase-like HAD superfamily hydrolase
VEQRVPSAPIVPAAHDLRRLPAALRMRPMADIEIANPAAKLGRFRAVLFDFDGTLSLLRECWPRVMIPMMVDVLRAAGARESDAHLFKTVEDFVMDLNGRPTIFQMIRLADEVRSRGGRALEPAVYGSRYQELLRECISDRIAGLASGASSPEQWTVPGSRELLEDLGRRGVALHLASGTDLDHVRREADLLRLSAHFGPHIHAPCGDEESFSKEVVIERLLTDHKLRGEELLAFGDGVVEIQAVRRAGGVAVGVASDERRCGVNEPKRARLLAAGADIIIADYRCRQRLIACLFGDGPVR